MDFLSLYQEDSNPNENMTMDALNTKTSKIFSDFSAERDNLIPILQKVQAESGYISTAAVGQIADFLKITKSQVYGVASFYSQFRFTPRGRHSITACLGTACHVRGGERIIEALERKLGIKPGQSTPDGRFDLNRVACLGCCALAPVVKVNDDIYSGVKATKLEEILNKYE